MDSDCVKSRWDWDASTNKACLEQLLQYTKLKEEECTADSDKDINNFCHNGAKGMKWLRDILFFTRFDMNFESRMTKEDIRKMIVNVTIIPNIFAVEQEV